MLCAEHRARVNQKLWCAQGEHELKRSDTVKGYEHEKGSYVVFEDDTSRSCPCVRAGPSAAKPYVLLTTTLANTGRVAIAKFALRDRERLVSLRAYEGALLLNTLILARRDQIDGRPRSPPK